MADLTEQSLIQKVLDAARSVLDVDQFAHADSSHSSAADDPRMRQRTWLMLGEAWHTGQGDQAGTDRGSARKSTGMR